jgi:hypothetical protein
MSQPFESRRFSPIGVKISRCSPNQIPEVSNHGRRIAAAGCEVQNGFRLVGSLEASIRNTVHDHSLHGSRNGGNPEAGCNEAQHRCDAGRFLAEAWAECQRWFQDDEAGSKCLVQNKRLLRGRA